MGTCAITNLPIYCNENVILYVIKNHNVPQANGSVKIKNINDMQHVYPSSIESYSGIFNDENGINNSTDDIQKKLFDRNSRYSHFYIKQPVHIQILSYKSDPDFKLVDDDLCSMCFKTKMRSMVSDTLIRRDYTQSQQARTYFTLSQFDKIITVEDMNNFDRENNTRVFDNWTIFSNLWKIIEYATWCRLDLYVGDLYKSPLFSNIEIYEHRLNLIQSELQVTKQRYEEAISHD